MSKIKAFLESTKGKSFTDSFINDLINDRNRKARQLARIKNLIIDVDTLVQRSIAKSHTHILKTLFQLAEDYGTKIQQPLDDFTRTFPFDGYEYEGYQFILIYGQGTQMSIYQDNIHLWSL